MPYKDPKTRKEKHREYSKRSYEKNKAEVIAKNNARKRKAREDWRAFKTTLACTQCGENHPECLDFHHVVRGKDNKKVHYLVRNGQYAAALREIEKCIVLCSNCHRKHHYEERTLARSAHSKTKKKPKRLTSLTKRLTYTHYKRRRKK